MQFIAETTGKKLEVDLNDLYPDGSEFRLFHPAKFNLLQKFSPSAVDLSDDLKIAIRNRWLKATDEFGLEYASIDGSFFDVDISGGAGDGEVLQANSSGNFENKTATAVAGDTVNTTYIDITGTITAGTPINVAGAVTANTTRSGDDGDLKANATEFLNAEFVDFHVNGVEVEKSVVVLWDSPTTFTMNRNLYDEETITIRS